MKHHTAIAIDLAKNSFQACQIKNYKPIRNKAYTRAKLMALLSKHPPCLVVMEACGSAHFWARTAEGMGHQAMIIAPKTVAAFRVGHKTDHNDAEAIAAALLHPGLKTVRPKTVEQQGLQSIERIREHLQNQRTATSNLIRSLVFEFGMTIPRGLKALRETLPLILEDAENELPMALRHELAELWHEYQLLTTRFTELAARRDQLIKQHHTCEKLMKLEGVGPVNALSLYLSLGNNGGNFANGREAAACIGLTPKQHSTGGKVVLGKIGKLSGNRRLRANLVQGARAVLKEVQRRGPANNKEAWIKALIERRGFGKASVALANKTVRTAWAMLHNSEDYRGPQPLAACC